MPVDIYIDREKGKWGKGRGEGEGRRGGGHTRRPLLLDQPLQHEIQHLAAELPQPHEHDLRFAR